MAWATPKTDWTSANGVADTDMNRIEENIRILAIYGCPYGVTTNSTNAYSVTPSPAVAAITDGLTVAVKVNATSTGSITLNVASQGAKKVLKPNGVQAGANDFIADMTANLRYSSSADSGTGAFILLGKGGGGDAAASHVLAGKTFTNDSGEQVGTMVNRAGGHVAVVRTAVSGQIRLTGPTGYYDGSDDYVYSNDSDFIPANIKNGVDMFGLVGTAIVPGNEFGTGADGAFSSTGSTSISVTAHSGVATLNYTSFTLNGTHSFTTNNPCRGLIIYVTGDVVIDGTLHMNAKAGFGGGLPPIPFVSTTFTKFNMLASALSTFLGGAGGAGGAGGNGGYGGSNTTSGGTGGSGGAGRIGMGGYGGGGGGGAVASIPGGAGGAITYPDIGVGASQASTRINPSDANGVAGNPGGGGSGGGSGQSDRPGTGGTGAANNGGGGGGGGGGGYTSGNNGSQGSPAGGLIVIIAGGNVTIGATGAVQANGGNGGNGGTGSDGGSGSTASEGGGGGGGGSGGGVVAIFYAGSYTNSGSITVSGGSGGSGASGSNSGQSGTSGTGGSVGSIITTKI